jgi:flagellar biosynthesis protein FliQ
VIELVDLARRALVLAVFVSLPVVVVSALVSLVVGAVQSVTHATDPAVSQLPRLVVIALALTIAGPWMGSQIVSFASEVFRGG